MADTQTGEYDFPTVRTGSKALLLMASVVICRILLNGATANTVDALKAILTAVGATHGLLVLGGGFINSRYARSKDAVEETVTTTRTVAPASVPTKVDTVNVVAETANVS
jgi:hypothetical protein